MRMVGIPKETGIRALSVLVAFCVGVMGGTASASSGIDTSGLQPMSDQAVLGDEGGNANAASRAARDSGLQAMSDSEMADVSGQALFQTSMIDGATDPSASNDLNFYRAGLDAKLDLNMNIENLELGRTGPDNWPDDPFNPNAANNFFNYSPNVDIWVKNAALGCTADASGNCVDSTTGNATQLKPLTLTRPYLEFAIENDDTKTQREVVGIRLGGENIQGPLSFGQTRSFSGYLSAGANMNMQGATATAATCNHQSVDYSDPTAPTGGCPNPSQNMQFSDGVMGTGTNLYGQEEQSVTNNPNEFNPVDSRYSIDYVRGNNYGTDSCTDSGGNTVNNANCYGSLNLTNEQTEVCVTIGFDFCANAQLSEVLLDFNGAGREGLDAVADGKRLTQAGVQQPQLGDIVDEVVETITVNTNEAGCEFRASIAGINLCTAQQFLTDLTNDLLRPEARRIFYERLCNGLPVNCTTPIGDNMATVNQELNQATVPYNLTNFHQVNINSSNLGLSFQKRQVMYPGQGETLEQGWSLFLPDAFTIDVNEPAAKFTDNIDSGRAGRGDLVALPPVYDNCFGSAQFC